MRHKFLILSFYVVAAVVLATIARHEHGTVALEHEGIGEVTNKQIEGVGTSENSYTSEYLAEDPHESRLNNQLRLEVLQEELHEDISLRAIVSHSPHQKTPPSYVKEEKAPKERTDKETVTAPKKTTDKKEKDGMFTIEDERNTPNRVAETLRTEQLTVSHERRQAVLSGQLPLQQENEDGNAAEKNLPSNISEPSLSYVCIGILSILVAILSIVLAMQCVRSDEKEETPSRNEYLERNSWASVPSRPERDMQL